MNAVVRWAFSLFLFLLPWQTRWIFEIGKLSGGVWEYGTISIYATEVFLWLLLLLHLFSAEKNCNKPKWLWVAAVFIFFASLSALWSPAPQVTIFAAGHLLSAFVLFYFLKHYSSQSIVHSLQYAFIAGVALAAILGIIQFAAQNVVASTLLGIAAHTPSALGASVIETVDGRLLRAYGGLPHPNLLGGYLAIGLLLTIDLLLRVSKKTERVLFGATSIVLGAGLLVTFSRSAWLGFLIGFIILTLLHLFSAEKRCNGLFRLLPMMIAVILFAIMGRGALLPRITGETRLEEISRAERVSGIKESFAVIRSSPWVGVGLGNYTAALANLAPHRPSWSYQPVHNVPLLILAELGLIGFILLIFLISKFTNLQTCKLLGTSPLILALLVIALLDHYPWSLYPGLLLVSVTIGLSLRSHEVGTRVRMEKIGEK